MQRLKNAFRVAHASYPFAMDAIVILPDHLHCLWQLPQEDSDFSIRWRCIKTYFSKGIVSAVNQRGEKQVWQRRFWEHAVGDEHDWRRHMDYIFYNPVKHGLVQNVIDWPHSSFKQSRL